MRIEVPYKHLFAIVGLPRSGTTIVNSIFDSLDNGFSISEPILMMDIKIDYLHFNKIPYIDCNRNELIDKLEEYLIDSDYDCGGLKETLRHGESNCGPIFESSKLDFIVFVFRHPMRVFSSWQRCKWRGKYSRTEYLHDCYKLLLNYYHAYSKVLPTFLIKYEDLCNQNSTEYLNEVFDGYLKFHGDIEINKSKYLAGDETAFKSTKLYPPSMKLSQFAKHRPNRMYIQKNILPIYDTLTDLQRKV